MIIRITDWCSDDPRFAIGTVHKATEYPWPIPPGSGAYVSDPDGGEHPISVDSSAYEIVNDAIACHIVCKGHCGQITDAHTGDADAIDMANVERCPECGSDNAVVEWFEEEGAPP